MGWTFPWVSSGDGDFNYDFGVSFSEADRAAGRALYNFGKTVIQKAPDMFGVSIFVKDEDGDIYHSYSTYHRGTELLMGAINWLDLDAQGPERGRRHHELAPAARRVPGRLGRRPGGLAAFHQPEPARAEEVGVRGLQALEGRGAQSSWASSFEMQAR